MRLLHSSLFQILRNISRLHIPAGFQDFKTALEALNQLDLLMCNPNLPRNYPTIIATWIAAWDALFLARENVTYFNKVHIANVHLKVSRFECSDCD